MIASAAPVQPMNSDLHHRRHRRDAVWARRLIATGGMIAGLAPVAILALMTASSTEVLAQTGKRLNAHYTISMIAVSIGQISWTVDIDEAAYRASASGKASGALSILVNGEGRAAVRGVIQDSRPAPTIFTSHVTDDGETTGLQMTFDNGSVKTLHTDKPLETLGRVPVSEDNRKGVSDPLTAMLVSMPPGSEGGDAVLTPQSCDRVLSIFDGQRRYNLALSYKRMDRVKIEHDYRGPVLVCGVLLHPVAGYRPDSVLVKYVGGRHGMEIWFAPITGTIFSAPVRLLMPTLIGTLEISADRFETAAPAPAPAPEKPGEAQR